MLKFLTGLLAVTLLSANAFAEEDDADASTPGPNGCPATQASTVFVADKSVSRKKGSASRLSETHKTAENQGWEFRDLEVYIENGDLQGFFVTYVREHPCNRAQ